MDNTVNPKIRILTTAEQLFAAKGYDGVTVRDIALQANVNVAMINYYFKNKDDLYLGIIESYLEEISAKLETVLCQESDPRQHIRLFIYCYVDFLFSKSKSAPLVLRAFLQDDNHIDKLLWQYYSKIIIELENSIIEGINEGYFIPVDPKLAVVSLLGMTLWYFAAQPVLRRLPWMENNLEDYKEEFARHTWELFIRGISIPE